jgi:cell division septation protein DedD
MEYQFSFDKKRLIFVFAGLLFAGVLTFCCGVVIGIGMWMPTRKELAEVRTKADPAEKVASAKAALKVPELPGKTAPIAQAAPPTPAVAPATAPAVPADPLAASAVAAAPNPADEPFVLQLGAFRDQKRAKELQTELKGKGYATTIFNMVDEGQKTWHMVRFGGFKDLDAAAQAASAFMDKEGIQALVRRSDSL